jgi:hypothetical protein
VGNFKLNFLLKKAFEFATKENTQVLELFSAYYLMLKDEGWFLIEITNALSFEVS